MLIQIFLNPKQVIKQSLLLSAFQLIGMLLACCLSRIITANQYEMV